MLECNGEFCCSPSLNTLEALFVVLNLLKSQAEYNKTRRLVMNHLWHTGGDIYNQHPININIIIQIHHLHCNRSLSYSPLHYTSAYLNCLVSFWPSTEPLRAVDSKTLLHPELRKLQGLAITTIVRYVSQ